MRPDEFVIGLFERADYGQTGSMLSTGSERLLQHCGSRLSVVAEALQPVHFLQPVRAVLQPQSQSVAQLKGGGGSFTHAEFEQCWPPGQT